METHCQVNLITAHLFMVSMSLSLLLKNYDNVLELLKRHKSFLASDRDLRFRALCTKEGVYSYINSTKLIGSLDIGQNRQMIKLIRGLKKEQNIQTNGQEKNDCSY